MQDIDLLAAIVDKADQSEVVAADIEYRAFANSIGAWKGSPCLRQIPSSGFGDYPGPRFQRRFGVRKILPEFLQLLPGYDMHLRIFLPGFTERMFSDLRAYYNLKICQGG